MDAGGSSRKRIREHGTAGRAVRPVGGGTKLGWGAAGPRGRGRPRDDAAWTRSPSTTSATSPPCSARACALADAQARFAAEGQMLALDPPLGAADGATIGGMIATADSGPLRHRYGGVRDLVVGMTVILSDGTVAKSGGKVIKNVAGYDLAKLFAGSYGTLGLIASVAVRLHPLPSRNATAIASCEDPVAAGRGGRRARRAPAGGRLPRRRLGRRPRPPARALRRRRGRAPGGVGRGADARGAGSATPARRPRTTRSGTASARCSARRTGSCSRSPAARPTCRP